MVLQQFQFHLGCSQANPKTDPPIGNTEHAHQFPSTQHAPCLNTPNTLHTRHESTQCDKDECYRHKDNCQQAMKYASVSATTPTKLHIITRQTSQGVLLSNSNHEPRRCPAKRPSDIAQGRRNLTQPHFFRIYRIQYHSSRFSGCSFPTEFTQ